MTLHQYLYCINDPVNLTDPTGEFWGFIGTFLGIGGGIYARTQDMHWSVSAGFYALSAVCTLYEVSQMWPTIEKHGNKDRAQRLTTVPVDKEYDIEDIYERIDEEYNRNKGGGSRANSPLFLE